MSATDIAPPQHTCAGGCSWATRDLCTQCVPAAVPEREKALAEALATRAEQEVLDPEAAERERAQFYAWGERLSKLNDEAEHDNAAAIWCEELRFEIEQEGYRPEEILDAYEDGLLDPLEPAPAASTSEAAG